MATRYNFFGGLVTDGLIMDLDAAKLSSYPAGGTAWVDISGNGNNGVLTNGPTFSGVGKQAAIVFDGVDDYILGGNITGYFTNQVYASAFYKLTSTGNYPMVLTLGIAGPSEGFSLRHANGNIELVLSSDSTTTLSPSPAASVVGQIVQVGLWYNGTTWKGYKNGVEFASVSKTGNIQFGSAPLLRLGARSDGFYFPGSIYNAQIYNRSLSAFEVWQNFNAYKSRYGIPDIVTNGLILNLDAGNPYSYYSPTSGTTWADTSGVGNNGTLTNGPVYSNGAITFDGVDDYVNVPYDASKISFPDNNATICVWFNSSPAGDNAGALVTQRQGAGFQTYVLSNRFYADGGGVTNGLFSTTTIVKGITYFGCAVYDKTNSLLKLYVNGIFESQISYTGNIQDTYPIRLGNGAYGDSPYPGSIYAAQVYNRALTQAEITQNYNSLRGRYGI
jgi:hypothetical protein